MSRALNWLSWLVTVHPWVTLVVIAIVTLVLAAGIGRRDYAARAGGRERGLPPSG